MGAHTTDPWEPTGHQVVLQEVGADKCFELEDGTFQGNQGRMVRGVQFDYRFTKDGEPPDNFLFRNDCTGLRSLTVGSYAQSWPGDDHAYTCVPVHGPLRDDAPFAYWYGKPAARHESEECLARFDTRGASLKIAVVNCL